MDRRFLRPGWVAGHLLVFAAVLTCLRLGWWQWERTQEATGTAQNFGYALLWPGFGVAFVYMWVRFLHLEVLKDAEDDEQTDRELRQLLADGQVSETRHDEPSSPADLAEPQLEVRKVPGHKGSTESTTAAGTVGDGVPEDDPETAEPQLLRSRRQSELQRPSQGVVVSVAMVSEDDDDDPELTAYNRALAALAEEDRRRAR